MTRLTVLAIAALGLVLSSRALVRAAVPVPWPTVAGRITQSHTEQVYVGTRIGRNSYQEYQTRFFVQYRYTVDGKSYLGTRIDAYSREGRKHPLTGESLYPENAAVRVHYRPSDPRDAVLELTVPWGWLLGFVGSILLGWLGFTVREPAMPLEKDEAETADVA